MVSFRIGAQVATLMMRPPADVRFSLFAAVEIAAIR
jgi:hypothetical protein